jgi:hypothetical protein
VVFDQRLRVHLADEPEDQKIPTGSESKEEAEEHDPSVPRRYADGRGEHSYNPGIAAPMRYAYASMGSLQCA